MSATSLIMTVGYGRINVPNLYVFGALTAIFILGYLIYSLIHPEKF